VLVVWCLVCRVFLFSSMRCVGLFLLLVCCVSVVVGVWCGVFGGGVCLGLVGWSRFGLLVGGGSVWVECFQGWVGWGGVLGASSVVCVVVSDFVDCVALGMLVCWLFAFCVGFVWREVGVVFFGWGACDALRILV